MTRTPTPALADSVVEQSGEVVRLGLCLATDLSSSLNASTSESKTAFEDFQRLNQVYMWVLRC